MPMARRSAFFDSKEYQFPVSLIEIKGKAIIELAIENYKTVKEPKRFIFVVAKSDCDKYHIDNVLGLLTDGNCEIIRLQGETKGAACSCLMAIKFINNNDQLIIANGDQIINEDMNNIIRYFNKNYDAGVICFETIHPRWSYVRLDKNNRIIETAEKRPLSNKAIAGFYYFKKGSDFVKAAMDSIKKDANVNGIYYVATTLNELVLGNRKLGIYKIENNRYHSLYSPQKIQEYEKRNIRKRANG
jgi:dTDP-glucose pyrophosphorylase